MISRWLSSTARRRRKVETSLSVALLGGIKTASVDDWSNRKGSGDMLGRSKQRTTPSDKFQLQNRL
ncbi:hypothetical protein F2Q68_00017744 [Brassica cretica]|uniref:Uncharacterized protein n=1 Tax=Brassica cretica TaxID=69181 RepID=A0A8S9HL35_BRACR|nr:hypothetical protein F2Q68_00017744 [Brassica cretica]